MNTTRKILIVDDMHESITPMLENIGFVSDYQPLIKREEIINIIDQYFGLIVRSKTTIDKELLDKASNLKVVARAGAGMDKVDVEYLNKKNIVAINAPEGNRDALGEHALGMLLSLLNKQIHSFDQIKEGKWAREKNRGVELRNKVIGIYGVGNMGRAFAKKLSGLECEVIGYDKYNTNYGDEFIEEASLEEFKERVEILSLHIPLKDDTNYLFSKEYLLGFKKLKVLINTARGKLVKTQVLLDLIKTGKLQALGLDVLENEKFETYTQEEKNVLNQLMGYSNVLITPHVGGWTYESYERINKIICQKLVEHYH